MNKRKCAFVNSTCSSFAGNPGLTRTSIDAKQVSHDRRKQGKGFRKVRVVGPNNLNLLNLIEK